VTVAAIAVVAAAELPVYDSVVAITDDDDDDDDGDDNDDDA
jgi:hypothetical protein